MLLVLGWTGVVGGERNVISFKMDGGSGGERNVISLRMEGGSGGGRNVIRFQDGQG